jgi:predicted DNA-binding transcriptional regulator YafY
MRNAEVIRQWQVLREIEVRRTGVTIHELAALVKVSTRTIRRDLQALQEAGFAVYDEGETNDTKRWKVGGSPFRTVQDGLSVADVAALYLSRTVVEGVSGWPLADELRGAFTKIEAALNPRMREFLSTLPQVISAKTSPRAGQSSADVVAITRRLFDATRDRRIVEMRYFSASSNSVKTYVVQPYRLALALGGLYLLGWVPAYDEFRTFAVERIQRLSVTEETFKRTRELPANPFGASLGVFSGEPQRIVVDFSPRLSTVVRTRVWHESQQIQERPDGGVRLTLDVTDDWALRSWLLGFGAGARVLEPAALVQWIQAEARGLLDTYAVNPSAARLV